jgi:hypothetical protein
MSSAAAVSDTFAFQFDLSVTSSRLKKTFTLQHEMVNGVAYIPLQRRSALAKLCCQSNGGKYFEDVNLFDYITDQRNDMITQIIQKAMTDDDIGADVESKAVPVGSERSSLFKKYKVPPVLTLQMPAFKSEFHECEAFKLNVLATPNQRAIVSIEASDKNLKWFAQACTYKWKLPKEEAKSTSLKRSVFGETLPDGVKVRSVSNKRICLYINYKRVEGGWSKYTQTIIKSNYPNADELNDEIQTCLTRMEQFYNMNHDHFATDEPGDDHDEGGAVEAEVDGEHEGLAR